MIRKPRTLAGPAPSDVALRFPGHRCAFMLIAFAWLLGPTAAVVRGQSYLQSTGVPSFTTQIPVENGWIDASNGRLHLEIPLGSFPQRAGRTDNVALVYDSNIWTHAGTTSWQPTNVSTSTGSTNLWSGWYETDLASTTENLANIRYSGWCAIKNDYKIFTYSGFTFTGPDGTLHIFPSIETFGPLYPNDCPSVNSPNANGWASDTSGFYMVVSNYGYLVVYGPDGTVYHPSSPPFGWTYSSATDSNGNYLGGPVSTTVNGNATTYNVPNSQGTTSPYTVKTGTISVNTSFGQQYVTEYSGTITVVTEIDLPDGSKYAFGYDSGTTGAHYGLLTSMTLPTGGQITYLWNRYTDSQGNNYPWISTRTTPDSATAWSYTPAVVTTCGSGQVICQQTFTVQKPNTDNTVYTFALNGGAWGNEVDFYTGSVSPSNLVAKATQCWSFLTITSGTCTYSVTTAPPATGVTKMAASTTLPTPGGSVSKTTQYSYDSYGNVIKTQENKYYTGGMPAVDRTTTITYLGGTSYFNANIVNRPTSVTVTDASGTVAQTNYSYDGSTLISGAVGSCPAVTGAAGHDDTNYGSGNTVRGNLTQIQRLISGTSNYVTTTMTYDITGQVRTSTDIKQNVTSYCYADNFYDDNGSNPPQPHSTTTPTNNYVTTITPPAGSNLATAFGYYYGTGQLAKVTDANGNNTYSHFQDLFNRFTGTSLPNNGWIFVQYDKTTGSNPIETGAEKFTGINTPLTTSCPATATPTCRHDQTIFDAAGLGRVASQVLVSDPDGQTSVDITYDPNGRVKTISNPHRGTSGSTDGLETPTYDGLDRSWKIAHADNNVMYTYYGAAITTTLGQTMQQCLPISTYGMGYPVLVVDEAGNKHQTWTDGFGRVIETDEPTSSGTLTAYTCYTYDSNNNLKAVAAVGGTQTRSYSYDMLSRVTSTIIPETGTTCFYYTTSVGTCGAGSSGTLCSGDPTAVCLRIDARNITTTYAYDNMNRLLSKSYNDSNPNTHTVGYSYDQTGYNGLTITNGKGRRTGMNDGSGQTAWSYDPVGNVLTEMRTTNGQTKAINYAYNLDGSIYTIQYPGTRTITYNEGNAERMTSVKDLTNDINYVTAPTSGVMYAPTAALASDIHGSTGNFAGITESYTYNNRLQITGVQATSSTGTALNLAYSYVSGNNNNIAVQTNNVTSGRTQTYTYDPLNRLLTAQAQATSGGDCWGQSFGSGGPPPTMATDALANLFYVTATKCSSPQPRFTVNGNNQFTGTGISYDPAGDVTADSAYTYTYDAENRIITATGMTNGPYCYTYDGKGLRVIKAHASGGSCTGSVTVDMLNWRLTSGVTIAETDGSGSTTNASYHEYIFFAGRRIAQSNPSAINSELLIGYADDSGNNWAATGAWTLRSTATNVRYGLEDQLNGGTGSVTAGFTITSAAWAAGIAAFSGTGTNAFVQKKDQYFANGTGAGSESVAFTSNVESGDLLLCMVGWETTGGSLISSVSDTRGNSYSSLPLTANSPHQMQGFYTFSTASGADTFTVNFSGSGGTWVGIACGEWSGPTRLDVHGEATGNSATPTSASITPSGGTSGRVYYYFVDHLGSTRVVTNSSGLACYESDFLPNGTEDTPAGFTNSCSTNYKFTGYERDAETAVGTTSSGNDYAFARYYNSRLGRFMSADPLSGDITDPQTQNRYAYVRNNPANLVDRLGMDTYIGCYDDDSGTYVCDSGGGGGWGCASSVARCDGQGTPPVPPKKKPGPATDCAFNIKVNNRAGIDPNQLTAAENQIAALFGPYVGVNFVTSGSADYSLNVVNASSTNYNLGQQTSFIFQGTPAVYPNNVANNFTGQSQNIINNIIGTVGAHELVHRITGIGDLPYDQNSPTDLMSYDDSPNKYSVLANNELQLTKNEGQKLADKCQKKHPN